MRKCVFALAMAVTLTPACAQEEPEPEVSADTAASPATAAGTEPSVDSWEMRLDRSDASAADVAFVVEDGGYRATTGPAAIFWDPSRTATGEYRASARFTLLEEAEHPESYGLFVGGRDLAGPDQDYLYFLVRQNGQYLVKHRAGDEETHTLFDWTPHEAVNAGAATNELAVEAAADSVHFLVNGQRVNSLERVSQLNTDGIVGLRINHRLDVRVEDFEVQSAGGE